jgi:hypothetical protein
MRNFNFFSMNYGILIRMQKYLNKIEGICLIQIIFLYRSLTFY